ncbi:hypothetical protein J132_09542 [Termitomyces sp. J132]|nr:hypothetical protein J132_09542 [Termitomyces sp. J132]
MCSYYILQSGKPAAWKCKWLLYVTALFSLACVNVALNIRFNELVYIDNRGYPGGPLAFLLQQQAVPVNIAGNSETIVISFLSDALLIYRCFIVYQRWWVIVIPAIMWIASTVFAVLFTIQAALPQSSLWAQKTLDFALPYFSIVMALNALLTILLVGRLLYMRRKIASVLGGEHGRMYSHIATTLLESAVPYGLVSFVFIILYGTKNTVANLFIPFLAQLAAISPTLIVLRVARGFDMNNETFAKQEPLKIKFQHKTPESSTDNGADGSQEVSMAVFRSMSESISRLRSNKEQETDISSVV